LTRLLITVQNFEQSAISLATTFSDLATPSVEKFSAAIQTLTGTIEGRAGGPISPDPAVEALLARGEGE